MPLSTDQLRQLLTERSEPARHRPAPQERITAHIRRARIRRAAGASLIAAVAVAAVVSAVSFAHQHASDQGAISGVPQFPAAFTASDGASYRRLAVTSMPDPAQRSATITVRAGSYPVDVMAACDAPRSGAAVEIEVNGVAAGGFGCPGTPQLAGLSVRPGRQAGITFVKVPMMAGVPEVKASWRFAVYEWKPPASARPAPPVPRLPARYTGNNTTTGHGKALRREIASRSGDWPGGRTATFTVTYHGRNLDISLACSGAIAGRLQAAMFVDGRAAGDVPCTSWTPGDPPPDSSAFGGRTGIADTLTFRIQAPSPYTAAAYAARAASWTISIYEEEF